MGAGQTHLSRPDLPALNRHGDGNRLNQDYVRPRTDERFRQANTNRCRVRVGY